GSLAGGRARRARRADDRAGAHPPQPARDHARGRRARVGRPRRRLAAPARRGRVRTVLGRHLGTAHGRRDPRLPDRVSDRPVACELRARRPGQRARRRRQRDRGAGRDPILTTGVGTPPTLFRWAAWAPYPRLGLVLGVVLAGVVRVVFGVGVLGVALGGQ